MALLGLIIAGAGLVLSLVQAGVGVAAAGKQIDDAVQQLKDAEAELQTRIDETDAEEKRRLAQADALIAAEEAKAAREISAIEGEAARKNIQTQAAGALAIKEIQQKLADLEAVRTNLYGADGQSGRWAELKREAEARYNLDQEALTARMAEIDAQLQYELGDIDRKITDLIENKDAAIAEATRRQEQLMETHTETIAQLNAQAAAGDVESQRKIDQIAQYRDESLGQTREEGVVQLNEVGAKGRFEYTQATVSEQMEKSRLEAQQSISGVRRSGSPLIAMRVAYNQMRAETERVGAAADYQMEYGSMQLTHRLESIRSRAQGDTEDIRAANLLFDEGLERARQDADRNFTQSYANLEATKTDIDRQTRQDYEAYLAEKAGKQMAASQGQAELMRTDASQDLAWSSQQSQFEAQRIADELAHEQAETGFETQLERTELEVAQTVEDIFAASDEAKRRVDESLLSSTMRLDQQKEDLIAEAATLEATLGRQKTDVNKEWNSLLSNRTGNMWAAGLGGTQGVLSSATSLLGKVDSLLDSPSGRIQTTVGLTGGAESLAGQMGR